MGVFLHPEKILDQLDLKPDMIAADFGCGGGDFVVSLAKKLEDGFVYGIDIQQEPLSSLKGRLKLENINNVQLIVSDLEKEKGSTLNDNSVDLVFIVNLLFQVEDKSAIIKEAKRVLRKDGLLLIIDWLPEKEIISIEGKISKKEVQDLVEKIGGFQLDKEIDAGAYHYSLIFKKINS